MNNDFKLLALRIRILTSKSESAARKSQELAIAAGQMALAAGRLCNSRKKDDCFRRGMTTLQSNFAA